MQAASWQTFQRGCSLHESPVISNTLGHRFWGLHGQTSATSESAWPDTSLMGEAFQILGFLGSLLLAASLVPQIMKLYKTKSAKDISLSYQVSYVLGLSMIVVYGFGRWLWPVYIPATIELVAALVVFSMKLYYDMQDRKRDVKDAGASPEVEVDVASAVSRSQCGDLTTKTL